MHRQAEGTEDENMSAALPTVSVIAACGPLGVMVTGTKAAVGGLGFTPCPLRLTERPCDSRLRR